MKVRGALTRRREGILSIMKEKPESQREKEAKDGWRGDKARATSSLVDYDVTELELR